MKVIAVQKLCGFWYIFVHDQVLDEVYTYKMPQDWEPKVNMDLKLILPPTEH